MDMTTTRWTQEHEHHRITTGELQKALGLICDGPYTLYTEGDPHKEIILLRGSTLHLLTTRTIAQRGLAPSQGG